MSHGRLLTHVVEEEYRIKRGRLRQRRLQNARLPEPWVIETYPFDASPSSTRKRLMALYDSLGYMTHSQNIIWMGGTGRGQDRLGHQLS